MDSNSNYTVGHDDEYQYSYDYDDQIDDANDDDP